MEILELFDYEYTNLEAWEDTWAKQFVEWLDIYYNIFLKESFWLDDVRETFNIFKQLIKESGLKKDYKPLFSHRYFDVSIEEIVERLDPSVLENHPDLSKYLTCGVTTS